MGTNFYMKRIPTEDDIQKIGELSTQRLFDELQNYLAEMNEEIHIGKRSRGWKFLFNHQNGEYFDPRHQESLKAWLDDPHYKIIDEYGEEYTFEQFWQMIRDWDANPRNKWDSTSYNEYERSRGNYYDTTCSRDIANRIHGMFGVRPLYYDFWLDGLRYSTSTEFS